MRGKAVALSWGHELDRVSDPGAVGGGRARSTGGGGRPQGQRALLAVLLLHRGEVVSTDRLIDELWGERASATAAKTVQVYVSNLRKALGDGLLVTRGHGYVLQAEPGQVDASASRRWWPRAAARSSPVMRRGAASCCGEALALWRGPPLADFAYEPFAQARDRAAGGGAAGSAGGPDRRGSGRRASRRGWSASSRRSSREHPLRERLQGQLMLALYRCGRQADALEHYRNARASRWSKSSASSRDRALQELERAILAHDPALDRRPERPGRRRRSLVARRRGGVADRRRGGDPARRAIAARRSSWPARGAGSVRVRPTRWR